MIIDPQIAQTVDRISSRFAWYRDLVSVSAYRSSGTLTDLPLMTETLLAREYYSAADHGHASTVREYHTSGTTNGIGKRILWSEDDHDRYVEQRTELLRDFIGPGLRTACADLGTGHAADSAMEIFDSLGLTSFGIEFKRPLAEHIALLNARRPEVVFTMPMILEQILVRDGFQYQPRKIIVLGDLAPLSWQHAVAAKLDILPTDVLDLYGSIEVGAIASYSHAEKCYLFQDHIIPETLPASQIFPSASDDGPVLILTNTTRNFFPAIRFVTGDRIQGLAKRVVGGKIRWGYDRLDGRIGAELKHGERLSLYSIGQAVNDFLPVAAWVAERTPDGHLQIRVDSTDFNPSVAAKITDRILQQNPDVAQMIRSGLVGPIDVVPDQTARPDRVSKRTVSVTNPDDRMN